MDRQRDKVTYSSQYFAIIYQSQSLRQYGKNFSVLINRDLYVVACQSLSVKAGSCLSGSRQWQQDDSNNMLCL